MSVLPKPRRHPGARLAAFALLALLLLAPGLARACRYNVRDVGFVDLETEPYRLCFFVRSNTPALVRDALRDAANRAFRDANVTPEIIDTDAAPGHPALAHRGPVDPSHGADPLAVLVSPDPHNPPLPVALPAVTAPAAYAAALAPILDGLVRSPLRTRLLDQVSAAFGVVLLLEGTDADTNRQARRTIAEAIDQVRAQMKTLPKAIAEPPALVVLDTAARATEAVLLWSLRCDPQPSAEPRAAALYGRARWIGPLMRGPEISSRNLVGLFSLVGSDCECGLDLSWTQGTRLPVRWDEARHAPLARALGFDPENPEVKTEVSWILSRRGSASANGFNSARSERPPTEAVPVTAATAAAAAVTPRSASPTIPTPPSPPTPISPTPPPSAPPPSFLRLRFLAGIATIGVAVLAIGIGILFRARRRQ